LNVQEQMLQLKERFQPWLKKWNLPKSSHLFRSILLILCLLLVCMLSYMTFFMDRFVIQAQTQDLHRSNLTMLEQVNDSFTQLTIDLEQQVRFFLTDQNVLHHLLSNEFCTSETRMSILQIMKNYTTLTPEVSGLWLYAPLTNTVLSSDGFLDDRYDSTIAPVLTRFESQTVPRSASDLRLSSVVQDGFLYILIDFVPAGQLGCFVFQVELQAMGLVLSQELPPILVTDSAGNVLLEGDETASAAQKFDLENTALYYQVPGTAVTKQQNYYRAYNDLLNWNLLMEFPASSSLGLAPLWVLAFPFLLALLLLGALGAYYITKKIYAPIDQLMRLTTAPGQPAPPAGEEIQFLEDAFRSVLHTSQELQAANDAQKFELRQFLCRSAIAGQLPEGLNASTLPSFIPEGLLFAALIRPGISQLPSESSEPLPSPLPILKSLLPQMPECLCWLEESADTLTLILHFSHNTAVSQSPQSCLDTFLNLSREKLGRPVLCGLGSGCTSLYQLKESYNHALESLRYNVYLNSDPDPATARSLKNQALTRQLKRLLDQPTQTAEEVQHQADRILQLTEQGAEDDAERIQRYELAQNLISEKLLLWDGTSPDNEHLEADDSVIQDRDRFLEYCTLALEVGQSMAGKKKYRYVEESKTFIQEHYMEADLSANDISAHVGISPSYFSSLFNELAKESVTSYLNRIRVEQAKKFLSNTKMPVKEIGTNCGFASANVFGRVFKKYTGQSPSQYRDNCTISQEGGLSHGQIT